MVPLDWYFLLSNLKSKGKECQSCHTEEVLLRPHLFHQDDEGRVVALLHDQLPIRGEDVQPPRSFSRAFLHLGHVLLSQAIRAVVGHNPSVPGQQWQKDIGLRHRVEKFLCFVFVLSFHTDACVFSKDNCLQDSLMERKTQRNPMLYHIGERQTNHNSTFSRDSQQHHWEETHCGGELLCPTKRQRIPPTQCLQDCILHLSFLITLFIRFCLPLLGQRALEKYAKGFAQLSFKMIWGAGFFSWFFLEEVGWTARHLAIPHVVEGG